MARIAVVDDDDKLAEMLVEGLTLAGHKPVRARDIEELEFMLRGGRPDLAIVDMQFRGGGGPKAVSLLEPETPVMVISGMPAAMQEKWFNGRKRTRYCVKPLKLEAIVKTVDELLAGG